MYVEVLNVYGLNMFESEIKHLLEVKNVNKNDTLKKLVNCLIYSH